MGSADPGGSPLEDRQWVAISEMEWGPLLGSEASLYQFGRGVIWLGQQEALVWEVILEV